MGMLLRFVFQVALYISVPSILVGIKGWKKLLLTNTHKFQYCFFGPMLTACAIQFITFYTDFYVNPLAAIVSVPLMFKICKPLYKFFYHIDRP